MGLPKIAMGQVLASSLGFTTAHLDAGPALGWVLHFAIGGVLALIYAAAIEPRRPGPGVLSWGLLRVLGFDVAAGV